MIAEEYSHTSNTPYLSNQEGRTINFILDCLKKACFPFKKASNQSNFKLTLNENKYTQIFVEQVEVFLKPHPNIGIKNQYSDIHYGTKGIPDFYFHTVEEGVYNEPIMVWEAKILSKTLGTKRKKEYLIGEKNNGGIERFKTEKHGKKLKNCGLIGFIENENPNFWLTSINSWIKDFATTNKYWKDDETLSELDSNNDYCLLESILHRNTSDIKLTHLWIILN